MKLFLTGFSATKAEFGGIEDGYTYLRITRESWDAMDQPKEITVDWWVSA